jgi:hypothetical protein
VQVLSTSEDDAVGSHDGPLATVVAEIRSLGLALRADEVSSALKGPGGAVSASALDDSSFASHPTVHKAPEQLVPCTASADGEVGCVQVRRYLRCVCFA